MKFTNFTIVATNWQRTTKASELKKLVHASDAQWTNYAELRAIQKALASENEDISAAASEAYDKFTKKTAVNEKGIEYSVFANALLTQRKVMKYDPWEWD